MTTTATTDHTSGGGQSQQQQQQTEMRSAENRADHAGGGGYALPSINVGHNERIVSGIGGGLLTAYGLSRKSFGGLALATVGGVIAYRGVTGHCGMYESLGINTADKHGAPPEEYFDRGVHVEKAVTIQRSPEECFAYWRNFENLPQFMYYLESVKVTGERTSHWVVKGPAGSRLEWDAEIINEEPNALIAWRSLGGTHVDNSGSVRFMLAPGNRGTEVRVVVDYIPPAGKLGATVAKLFGRDAAGEIQEDLRRFKRIMEAGEVPTTVGQPRGTCGGSAYRQKLKIA